MISRLYNPMLQDLASLVSPRLLQRGSAEVLKSDRTKFKPDQVQTRPNSALKCRLSAHKVWENEYKSGKVYIITMHHPNPTSQI